MINCYWLRTTTVLDTDVKTLIKMLEQQWHLLEEGTCNSDESAVDFPARDLAEMTSFINKFFPFNNSSKPIVLERRKMEEVVAICQQLKGFLQQKIVKAWRFAPRCNVTGVVILSDRDSGVEGPS